LTQVQEVDDLVDDWIPEPLVATPSQVEQAELEKRPVLVGLDILASYVDTND